MRPFLFIMRSRIAICLLLLVAGCREMMDETPSDPEAFSVRLLETVRKEGLYRAKLDTLSNSSIIALESILKDDNERKAFWINLYNAFVQIRLREAPARYEQKELFFEEDLFRVGTARFSLKDLEEGLLNRKFDKGFPKILKKLAVDEADPNTYFALNCGAKECPPIAYYSSEGINDQLELAKKVFITGTTTYDPFSDEVRASEFLQWHEQDFGGTKSLMGWFKAFGIVPVHANPEIVFTEYNWSPNTGKYID